MKAKYSKLIPKSLLFNLQKNIHFNRNFINCNCFCFSNQLYGIVGAGQMGTGIAYVYNRVGKKRTIVYDANANQLNKSSNFINNLLDKEIQKNKLSSEEKTEILKRFTFSSDINQLKDITFLIEAVPECFEIKNTIFKQLDKIIASKDTILASNTSSISITKLAAIVSRPEKVIGMHFMNPVPVMRAVEVTKGLQTSDETFKSALQSLSEVNKEVVVSKDSPGFIVNRILMPMINEAIFTYQEGLGTREDIDKGMVLSCSFPMGPLTLADFIGLDTCLNIMNVLYSEMKDPKFRPSILLVNYVNAGWLGRKTGKGFYDYNKSKK